MEQAKYYKPALRTSSTEPNAWGSAILAAHDLWGNRRPALTPDYAHGGGGVLTEAKRGLMTPPSEHLISWLRNMLEQERSLSLAQALIRDNIAPGYLLV